MAWQALIDTLVSSSASAVLAEMTKSNLPALAAGGSRGTSPSRKNHRGNAKKQQAAVATRDPAAAVAAATEFAVPVFAEATIPLSLKQQSFTQGFLPLLKQRVF